MTSWSLSFLSSLTSAWGGVLLTWWKIRPWLMLWRGLVSAIVRSCSGLTPLFFWLFRSSEYTVCSTELIRVGRYPQLPSSGCFKHQRNQSNRSQNSELLESRCTGGRSLSWVEGVARFCRASLFFFSGMQMRGVSQLPCASWDVGQLFFGRPNS